MQSQLELNLSNFQKARTKKDGPKWRFTTTIVERFANGSMVARASINGCMYAASKRLRLPGVGSRGVGFYDIVNFCAEWVDVVEDVLAADERIQEYLKDVVQPKAPDDPTLVPDLMLNIPLKD